MESGSKLLKQQDFKYPFDRISHSMVRDYLRCPKLFYYKHILKIKLPMKSLPLIFGGAVHKAVEMYYNGNDPNQTFELEFQPQLIEPFDQKEFEDHLIEGKRLISSFIDHQDYFVKVHGIDPQGKSEQKFRTCWRDPITFTMLPLQISGIFDRITDCNQIIEFKTSSKPYKQNDVDVLTQASMYSFSYYMLNKIIPKDFFYIVLIKGRKNNPIQVLKTSRTKQDFSQIFQTVDLILKSVKGDQFQKGTGLLHNWCDCYKYEKTLLLTC